MRRWWRARLKPTCGRCFLLEFLEYDSGWLMSEVHRCMGGPAVLPVGSAASIKKQQVCVAGSGSTERMDSQAGQSVVVVRIQCAAFIMTRSVVDSKYQDNLLACCYEAKTTDAQVLWLA